MTAPSTNTATTESRLMPAFEVIVVFLAMLAFTWLAKSADLVAPGSAAIWGGIVVATVFMRRRGVSWADYGLTLPRGKRSWFKSVGLAVAAALTIIAGMVVVSLLLVKLGFTIDEEGSDRFQFFLGNPQMFISYVVVVIWFGAALGEELFMRGFIMNRLADMFGQNKLGWSLAVLAQAVVFGAMHISQGSAGMITTGFVGLIFGTYYVISKKRLFPIILAHGFINTIGITAYYLSDGALT